MDNTIINCDEQGKVFSGVSDCGAYDTGDYVRTDIVRDGTTIPNDSTYLAKYKEAVRKNNIVPFEAYDYRNAHEDNQINTSSTGNMRLMRLGKPMFEVDLALSICELKEASKINNTSNRWNIQHVFERGIVCAKNGAGEFVPFDCNVVHLESTKLKQGADLQMKTLKAQLNSATQYNEGMTLIPFTEELSEIKELKGIIGLNVVVSVVDDTTLDVTITDACSGNGVDGITETDMVQLIGSTASTISTIVSNGSGNYTYTVTTLVIGKTAGVKVAEAGFQSIEIDGSFYGGSSELTEVGAGTPVIYSATETTGTVGTPFTFNVLATNIPTSYAVVDALPAGLTLNTSTGVISGTPTGSANVKVVQVTATNATGTGSGFLKITIGV